ncbi:MAG: 6-phosphofructokinase [Elusimicrobiota bacterium]
MKNIAVLTSGGDAPAMNACIRAVVRTGVYRQLNVFGVYRGFSGLIRGEIEPLGARSVSNIIQHGGTILKTSRCPEFLTEEGRKKAARVLEAREIDGLVAIGGDGTFRGAQALGQVWGGKIIGVPGTIDNDVYGTDYTIGFDTAINTALDAIDKIRDTAEAFERVFLVEVMGRASGFISLAVGIAGGVEEVLVPGFSEDIGKLSNQLIEERNKGKTSWIIVVAEGDEAGGAFKLAHQLKELNGLEYRVCVLGHTQRGGAPSARDRVLASKLGAFAVDSLLKGETGKMTGEVGEQLVLVPLADTWQKKKDLDGYLYQLIKILSV